MLELQTTRFGIIKIKEEEIFEFVQGLIGFEQDRGFILFRQGDKLPLFWLQSVETPELALVVTDPWNFVEDYEFTLNKHEKELLELEDESSLLTLVTVNLRASDDITINLKGPILLNRRKKKGLQIVLDDEEYKIKYRISKGSLQSA